MYDICISLSLKKVGISLNVLPEKDFYFIPMYFGMIVFSLQQASISFSVKEKKKIKPRLSKGLGQEPGYPQKLK